MYPSEFDPLIYFQEIRAFEDHEVREQLNRLSGLVDLPQLLSQFLPIEADQSEQIAKRLSAAIAQIESISDWQTLIKELLVPAVETTFTDISYTGIDNLSRGQPCLFISNHRDIVLDPLLLDLALDTHQHDLAYLAIGDNLLGSDVSDILARINRCFKIPRSIKSPKAAFKALKMQSAYIRYLLQDKKNHVWIAQKEGRAKDNIDQTNPALIKMLALARDKGLELGEYFETVTVVPVTFSYEYDPCAIDKALELKQIDDSQSYVKTAADDLEAVRKSLLGFKGKCHVHFDTEFAHQDLSALTHDEIAMAIDRSILKATQTYPVNELAARLIEQSSDLMAPSTWPVQLNFEQSHAAEHLQTQLTDQCAETRRRVVEAYASSMIR